MNKDIIKKKKKKKEGEGVRNGVLWFAYCISAGGHILLGVVIVLDQLGGEFIQGLKTMPHRTKVQNAL